MRTEQKVKRKTIEQCGAEGCSSHPSPLEECKKTRLYLRIVADDHTFDMPVCLGGRHEERLTAIADFVRSQGGVGVPLQEAIKFGVRQFFVPRETAIKDIKNLLYADVLSQHQDRLFPKQPVACSKQEKLVIGGLHSDDFHAVKDDYEAQGWVLTAFELDEDRYHWKARFVLNEGDFDE
jgi:hypothetical protein